MLTSGLELGLRHDDGDAETGTGIEVGGRVAYAFLASGLSIEASARTLCRARGRRRRGMWRKRVAAPRVAHALPAHEGAVTVIAGAAIKPPDDIGIRPPGRAGRRRMADRGLGRRAVRPFLPGPSARAMSSVPPVDRHEQGREKKQVRKRCEPPTFRLRS